MRGVERGDVIIFVDDTRAFPRVEKARETLSAGGSQLSRKGTGVPPGEFSQEDTQYRMEKIQMSKAKMLTLAAALVFASSQLALAQAGNPASAGGGGAGTVSGHSSKAQNNNRGPGKNPGGPGQGYQ